MLIDKIIKQVEAKDLNHGSALRLSSAGKCGRAIAYRLHGYEGAPLGWRGRLVFGLGDMIEEQIRRYVANIEGAIIYEHDDERASCSITVDGHVITGHVDGEATLNGDRWILEVKSMNARAFARALKGTIDYSYASQAVCYQKAKGIPRTLFIIYNKDTSAMCEVAFIFDENIYNQAINRFRGVLESTKENLPDREYAPDKKGNLPWQCSYCDYNKHCWPHKELSFEKGKPVLTVTANAGGKYE